MKFEHLASIQALKVMFEQVTSNLVQPYLLPLNKFIHIITSGFFLQSQDNSGLKSTANVLDPRKWIDERTLEKEEEECFNYDRLVFYLLDIKHIPLFLRNSLS